MGHASCKLYKPSSKLGPFATVSPLPFLCPWRWQCDDYSTTTSATASYGFETRGQWPYRLASYGDELIISDSKLGLKFEIRGINHTDIYVHEVNVAFNSYFSGL